MTYRQRTTKLFWLEYDGVSIDQTDRFTTKAQATKYFRSKFKWDDKLQVVADSKN